jgi:hypothetical protein
MKVLAHAHTLFSSDGELTPQELADLARRRGFSAVLVSDHFESLTAERFAELRRACSRVTGCLLAPGYERSWNGYHVLALGVDAWFDDADLGVWAGRVRAAGGITVLAHPSRYRHRVPASVLGACDAVEVWNSKFAYDGALAPNPAAFDLLGPDRYPLCGQDLHGRRHASSVALRLSGPYTTAREIVECLKRGDYWMENRLWRFERQLPSSRRLVCALFHRGRRIAVNLAIRIRWLARTAGRSLQPRSPRG